MGCRRLRALLASSLLLGGGSARARPPAEEKPLPVARTAKIQEEGAVYTVEGRVRVPRGVEVTIFRDIIVKAKGTAPAVIEVEGQLDVVGTIGKEVIFENVTVEPQANFEAVRMDMVIFRGSGGFRTPDGASARGALQAENADLLKGTALDLVFQAGSVTVSSVCSDAPVRIRTEKPAAGAKEQVRINVRNCRQNAPKNRCTPHGGRLGLAGGLEVNGGDDVTLQFCRAGGALTSVRNWGSRLLFDGMKIDSARLEFSQAAAGQYQKAQCTKCDIYSAMVVATAPPDPNLKDTLVMDRCWWKGLTDPQEILRKVVKDGADDPAHNGVRVALPKVSERPFGLAGDLDR